jgi:hypothetical protein
LKYQAFPSPCHGRVAYLVTSRPIGISMVPLWALRGVCPLPSLSPEAPTSEKHMQFLANVLGAALVILLLTVTECFGQWLAGAPNIAAVIAALIFVGMNRLVLAKPILDERALGWDYLATSIGLVAIIAAAFQIVENQARIQAQLITPSALVYVDRYVSTWCIDPIIRNDTTKVTCPLASEAQDLLYKSLAISDHRNTERSAEQLIKTIISSNELHDRIELADQYDLEALVPKATLTPELGQFGVVVNYVAILNNLLVDVDRRYGLPWGLEWVKDIVNYNSAVFLWLLFNAGLIKLALILSKVRSKSTVNL